MCVFVVDRQLPLREDLQSLKEGTLLHHRSLTLSLHSWLLSSDVTGRKDFLSLGLKPSPVAQAAWEESTTGVWFLDVVARGCRLDLRCSLLARMTTSS
jgi:hypothetical protein